MRKIVLVTDSSAALPDSLRQQMEAAGCFVCCDLQVWLGEQELRTSDQAQVEEALLLAQLAGSPVKTAGVSGGVFVEVYQQLAEQGFEAVLSVHLAAGLSATYQAACWAAGQVDIPVAVVDSQTAGMGLGYPLIRLYEHLEAEGDLARAVELAELWTGDAEVLFWVPSLEPLKRGGRINPALARVGQLLHVQPLVSLQAGRLQLLERPRNPERALELLIQRVEASCRERASLDAGLGRVEAIHYLGNLGQAWALRQSLGPLADSAQLLPLPPVLAAHTGAGVLAAIVF